MSDSDNTQVSWLGQNNAGTTSKYDYGVNISGNNNIATIPTGWHHWIMMFDGTNGLLFLDGTQVSSAAATHSLANTKLAFGRRSWDASGYTAQYDAS